MRWKRFDPNEDVMLLYRVLKACNCSFNQVGAITASTKLAASCVGKPLVPSGWCVAPLVLVVVLAGAGWMALVPVSNLTADMNSCPCISGVLMEVPGFWACVGVSG